MSPLVSGRVNFAFIVIGNFSPATKMKRHDSSLWPSLR